MKHRPLVTATKQLTSLCSRLGLYVPSLVTSQLEVAVFLQQSRSTSGVDGQAQLGHSARSTKNRTASSCTSQYNVPVRGIVATSNIPRGAVIAAIPERAFASGRTAAELLDHRVTAAVQEQHRRNGVRKNHRESLSSAVARVAHTLPTSLREKQSLGFSTKAMTSRDALLLTTALAANKLGLFREVSRDPQQQQQLLQQQPSNNNSNTVGGEGNAKLLLQYFDSVLPPTFGAAPGAAVATAGAPAVTSLPRRLRDGSRTADSAATHHFLDGSSASPAGHSSSSSLCRDLALRERRRAAAAEAVSTSEASVASHVDHRVATTSDNNSNSAMTTTTTTHRDVEAIPTSAIMTAFYMGSNDVAATLHSQAPRRGTVEDSAYLRHLAELNRSLETMVLDPLATILQPLVPWSILASPPQEAKGMDDDIGNGDGVEEWRRQRCLDALHWAHGMVRSRCFDIAWPPHANRRASEASTSTDAASPSSRLQCLFLPLLDLLNHDGIAANVVWATVASCSLVGGLPAVVATTSRDVNVGEELTLDYHRRMSHALAVGGSEDRRVSSSTATSSRLTPLAAANATLRRVEDEQRFEIVPEDMDKSRNHSHSAVVNPFRAPAAYSGVTARMAAQAAHFTGDASDGSGTTQSGNGRNQDDDIRRNLDRRFAMTRTTAAAADAEWVFQFGFVKSVSEKTHDASCMWDDKLHARVANLTDIRRKGRPGEFVVGIPEGLRHLRAQREELERERYNSQRIFPPQRTL